MTDETETTDLKPKFGLVGITSYIVGIIIGSGIYITSNNIYISVGSWGGTLLIWGLTGVLSILGALSWAELAAAHPRQGGTYIYILKELGHFPAFLYIITRVTLLNPASQAVNALASAKQIQIAFLDCVPGVSSQLLACALTMLMTYLHSFHSNLTSKLNTTITGVKILTLVGIFICAVVYLSYEPVELGPWLEGTTDQPLDLVQAFNGCYWSLAGWQACSAVIEEVSNPRRTFPRAVVAGVGMVTLVYLTTNLAFILVLTPEQIRSSTFIVNTFAGSISGLSLALPFSLLVFAALFGSFLSFGLVSGRYMYSAAREGDLPHLFSLLHWKLNTPIPAQALHMVLTIILIFSTDKIYLLLNLFVFVSIGFDLLVLTSLFVLKYRTRGEKNEHFRVSVVVPVLYSLFILAIFAASFLKGVSVELLVPAVYLVLLSGVYLLVIKHKILHFSFARVEEKMSQAFLLIPTTEKNE